MTDEQVRRLEERLDANGAAIELMAEQLDRVRTEDIPGIRVYVAGELSALREKSRLWTAAAGVLGALAAVLVALAAR